MRTISNNEFVSKIILHVSQEATQRLALPALGQGRRSRPARKRLRRRKLLEMAQNPQRQVHALLAGVDLPKHCFANQAYQNLLCPNMEIILEDSIRDLPAK